MNAPMKNPFETAPANGEAIEVAPDVFWIRMPMPMVLDHVNCYALADHDGWTIVDTGLGTKKTRALWASLLSEGALSHLPVARVLLTHHHPDHVGLAGWFVEEHGAELITTRTAYLMARMLVLDEQDRPTRQMEAYWRSAGMGADILQQRLNERPFNFADVVDPIPLGFRRIREGSELRLAGRDWVVRIGNGHAPEHATLWSEAGDIVLGGDQLLATISPNLGVHATEPDADPVGEWLESCEALKPYANDTQLVLPGHKLPFTGLPARLSALIENHHSALTRLEEWLQAPHTACACFPILFKRKIGAGEYGLAMVEAVAHLNHLYQAGRITRRRDANGAWIWQAGSVN
jgi:glyoxylase-like metal-dependent hydrolase (beta-lactamase superfamily II)